MFTKCFSADRSQPNSQSCSFYLCNVALAVNEVFDVAVNDIGDVLSGVSITFIDDEVSAA